MEDSTNIESYKLPMTDVQESRRNFSGYQVNQYVTVADLQQGDTSGTTDTDEVTDTDKDQGITSIYSRMKGKEVWKNKRT